jgi:mono/diheme cytochrome c family protein
LACEPASERKPPVPPDDTADASASTAPTAKTEVDTALGGQLYDKWFKVEGYTGGFSPDAKNTEVVDGAAGPNGDGTLNNGGGQPVTNSGHDYRLKNLFGWDLRGAEGVYGPDYQNKTYVRATNLLTDTRTPPELVEWFTRGDDTLPAFGEVLSPTQIEALVGFVVGVRDGTLPRPEQIFTLSADAPKNYTLVAGADAAAGAASFEQRCSGCHGDAGENILIDGDYTVGAFGRMKAYEGWLKVLNGHPGSPMARQSDDAREILNIFAALCDRTAFPPHDAEHEVADGDLRCGAYLK